MEGRQHIFVIYQHAPLPFFNWVGMGMSIIKIAIAIAAYMVICSVFMVVCFFCNRFTFFFLYLSGPTTYYYFMFLF
jgi:hypothetical protein